MKIYQGLNDVTIQKKQRCVAVGIFDGVHRGHRKILQTVLSEAKRLNLPSMVVTFDPHPNKILNPRSKHPIIMSLPHRLRIFKALGISETLVIPFNKAFHKAKTEAVSFF